MVDDSALRAEAMKLLREARQHVPRTALAAHVVDHGRGVFVVEVVIGPHGPEQTNILLDLGGPEQTVLCQLDSASEVACREPAPPTEDGALPARA
jgi:hypothetical protein